MQTVNELDYAYRKLVVKAREKRNNTIDISDEEYDKYYNNQDNNQDEENDINNSLKGTWQGDMNRMYEFDGYTYDAIYSEICFLKDPYSYNSGEGYWYDYYNTNQFTYCLNHIDWAVNNNVINIHFIEEGTYIDIENYSLDNNYFVGTIYNEKEYNDFRLVKTEYKNYDNMTFGWVLDGNNLYKDICKFTFDNTIHQSQIMYELLQHDYDAGYGNSAVQLNTFYLEGVRYWKLKSYNSEEQYIFSAIEQRQNYIIPNNGIIIMPGYYIHGGGENPNIILAKCPDCDGNLILYYDKSINEYYVICDNCNHSQTLNWVSNGLGDEHYGNIEPHNTMINKLYYYSNTFKTHTIIGCNDAIEISES